MLAYVGCRTTRERGARGEGVAVFQIAPETNAWSHVHTLADIANPSYLLLDDQQTHLYCVHGDQGEASAFAIDPASGRLSLINTQACGGRNPVHLSLDPTGRFLIVANYATGTIGVLPVRADGGLAALCHTTELTGRLGPHRTQQAGLYPHHIPYDPSRCWLVVPDKGGDQVCVFRFDPAIRGLIASGAPPVKTRPGAGPRHIEFHAGRPFAYLANELDSTVATYAFDAGTGALEPRQILPSIPPTFFGENTTAAIAVAPSGRFVYISNRGHDSIAIFAVDAGSGTLSLVGFEPTRGQKPRFFALDPSGATLYVANEASHTIVPFRVDATTGRLDAAGPAIETGSPTCIVFRSV